MITIQPRKKRKEIYTQPLHQRRKMMGCMLSSSLRETYHRKSVPVREGDQVEVMRGGVAGTRGNVTNVDLKRYRIAIENVTRDKSKGGKVFYPVHPSNVMITRLALNDAKRKKMLERT